RECSWPRDRGCAVLPVVDIATVRHIHDGDCVLVVVDAVYHAVGAAPGAVAICQRRSELLAYSVRIVQQWAGDELECGKRGRFGHVLGDLTTSCRSHDQAICLWN